MTLSSMAFSSTLGRRADDDVATGCTRYRALHRNQVTLGVDLDHFQTLRRTAHGTHVTGHLLAREHATRGLTLTDRTRRAMRQRVTVGSVTHFEVPALDRALEALAFRHAGHVNDLPDGKHVVSLDLGAHGVLAEIVGRHAELPQTTTRLNLGLRVMTFQRLRQQVCALGARRNLDGAVAIVIIRLQLGHAVRRRFNQRHRNRAAIFSEESAHAAFAAYQSDTHLRILSVAQPSLI